MINLFLIYLNLIYFLEYLDHSKCIREVALNDVDCSSLYLDILTVNILFRSTFIWLLTIIVFGRGGGKLSQK